MRVLVVNAGSSSLKLRLLDARNAIEQSADLPAGPAGLDTSSLARVLQGWDLPDAVGHRIVHGGTKFTGPVLIDGAVRDQLQDLTDLAPLHQPKSGSLGDLTVTRAGRVRRPVAGCSRDAAAILVRAIRQ